jgi:hypothetical protein
MPFSTPKIVYSQGQEWRTEENRGTDLLNTNQCESTDRATFGFKSLFKSNVITVLVGWG